MQRAVIVITVALLCSMILPMNESPAKVITKEVTYKADGISLKGYLAYDDAQKSPRPGVLVVHEWWGHNDYVQMRARMLAQLGYVAFAVDMYGNGSVADNPGDAGKMAGEAMSNLDAAKAKFSAALEYLRAVEKVDPSKIAAIGYCFGGGVVLQMARLGVDLKGVVSFHGSLATKKPAEAGKVKASVLVCHGGADQFVPDSQIADFKKEMSDAKVDYTFITYPGAKHAFTNPEATKLGKTFKLDIEYNKAADQKSWSDMRKFFDTVFKSNG